MVYLCTSMNFFFTIINHSFNKIFLLLGNSMDQILNLPSNTVILSLITSTIFSSIGKILGIYSHKFNLKKLIPLLFICSAITILLSFFCKNIYYFFIFRNLQGLFSGLEASICFGLLGQLYTNKSGFSNFNFISIISSLTTCIFLYFLPIKYLIFFLVFLCFNASLVLYIQLKYTELLIKKPMREINQNLNKVILNKQAIIFAIKAGLLLSCILFLITKQKPILNQFSNKVQNILGIIPFIMASVSSLLNQNNKYYNLTIYTSILIFLVLYIISFQYTIFFPFSIGSLFVCFTTFSPKANSEVVNMFEDKFTASAYIFSIRSTFTAIGLYILQNYASYILMM